MYCNQGFKNIVCGESLYNEFVYYYLKNNVDYLQSLGTGATFKEISKKVVEKIEIPVPSITEQKQIVSELDLLSEVIEKQKAQLEELDKLAQSIFYDMFGDPVTNDKDWKSDELAKVAPQKESDNKVPDLNGKSWVLNLDMVQSNTGEIIKKVYLGGNEIGNSTIVFDKENVLYSKLRPYLNKVVLPYETGYGTSELVPLRPNKQFLNRIFLAYILRSKQFVEFISIKVQGAKMPRVSMNSLRGFHVILPPLSLQQEFAAKIEAIEAMKAKVRQSLKEAETLFNERMDYYFN
jgi:type I restriction enzyme S subunit